MDSWRGADSLPHLRWTRSVAMGPVVGTELTSYLPRAPAHRSNGLLLGNLRHQVSI